MELWVVILTAVLVILAILQWLFPGPLLRRRASETHEVSRTPPEQPGVEPDYAILPVPIPPGPPIVMRDGDFESDIGADRAAEYEIIKPRPDNVVKYER